MSARQYVEARVVGLDQQEKRRKLEREFSESKQSIGSLKGFDVFIEYFAPLIRQERPHLSEEALSKELSCRWENATEEQRRPFHDIALRNLKGASVAWTPPRPASSAFQLFQMHLKENGVDDDFERLWESLSGEQRNLFEQRAESDRIRYRNELEDQSSRN